MLLQEKSFIFAAVLVPGVNIRIKRETGVNPVLFPQL